MRGHVTRSLLLGILLCVYNGAHAAFITDKIVVNLYAQATDQGQVLKKLPSGAVVEVISNTGQFTQVRTTDNITGWIVSQFITNEKPSQLEYLELLGRTKTLEAELKAAREKPSTAPAAAATPISVEELADLQQRAKDAGWIRAELKKARDRVDELEAQMNAKVKTSTGSQQEIDKLRADNMALEERLAATLLVNEQPPEQQDTAEPTETADDANPAPVETASADTPDNASNHNTDATGWSVKLKWFLGSLAVALIAGFIAGITWLDNRIRQRHGGFRLY